MSRVPAAFRPPALASWVILLPLRAWAFLAVGLPASHAARTPTGLSRSARASCDRGGCPLDPETAVLSRLTASVQPAPAALQRPVLRPRWCVPSAGLEVTRHHRGFTRVHPSGLPLACDSRMEREPLGFPPELRTPRLPAAHVRAGTGLEHWPGTTPSTTADLLSVRSLNSCDLVSHDRDPPPGPDHRQRHPGRAQAAPPAGHRRVRREAADPRGRLPRHRRCHRQSRRPGNDGGIGTDA